MVNIPLVWTAEEDTGAVRACITELVARIEATSEYIHGNERVSCNDVLFKANGKPTASSTRPVSE
jgi:hypothetical protein